MLEADRRELATIEQTVLEEHRELKEKATRMNENLKKMKYEDAMESKANITTNRLNR